VGKQLEIDANFGENTVRIVVAFVDVCKQNVRFGESGVEAKSVECAVLGCGGYPRENCTRPRQYFPTAQAGAATRPRSMRHSAWPNSERR
jgi:hypothetical protein